jgi:TolB protein
MKKLFLLLTILFSFNLMAQEGAAVIAVGEAEQDKDKLVIDDAELGTLSGDNKALALELVDMLKNNFSFYKHKFNNVDYKDKGKNSFSTPAYEKWAEGGVTYLIASKMQNKGSSLEAGVKVYNILTKKEVLNTSVTVTKDQLSEAGHRLSDAIYRSITGKPSVFLSKIVFISDRTSVGKDKRKELYMMDFDGRRVEKLTNFNSMVLSPSVSPDNSKIMFSLIANHKETSRNRVRTIKNIDLMMLDLRSKKVSTLSARPGINSGAIFTADGESMYVTLSYTGNADIYEMGLNGGKMRKVTSHYADDVDPSVTADGSLMTFLSSRSGRAHIYTMDPRSTEKDIKRISFVGQFNATPRFSPDGKEIVFVSWVDGLFDLYRIDSQGNNLFRLTKDFGSNEEPAYSPDGEFIIFTSRRVVNRQKAVQEIWIMNREGEILGQLTKDFGECFSPQWTNIPK